MMENLWPHVRLEEMRRQFPPIDRMIDSPKRGRKRTKGEEKMRRNEREMRNEKKEKKRKNEGKERKEGKKRKERIRREKREEKEKGGKGKGRFSRVSGGRRSKVRGLKLVHAVGSTCGSQKVGVSTNSKR